MRMNRFPSVFLAAAILLAGLFAIPANATDDSLSYARIVRLSYVTGDVQIMRPGENSKWEPAFANMPVQQGFTIGTTNGVAEIEFEQGGAVWLSRNSVLQFTELALSDGGRITKIVLAQGTASFQAGVKAGDTFEVSTPQFQITPAGRSGFRVESFVGGTGGSVANFSGRLSISSPAGTQNVAQGETLMFNGNAPAKATISNNAPRDSWDRWVSTRENYLVNGDVTTQQYSNSPNTYGSADLSAYGSWNYVAGCGYGWQPYGVTAGWMPFLDGQWMNYSDLGWTWVSFEQWGWMPYHFGGWANCGGAGWMWMPGENNFWNPGYVQWVGNGGHLGWRPRPPHNPRVNPPHPAISSVVMATKNLTKEGRYEVKSASSVTESFHELSGPPLVDGKVAAPGTSASNARQVLVPTAANLAQLRSITGGGLPPSPVGHAPNGGSASGAPGSSRPPVALPAKALVNAALPPGKVPSAPPMRAYAFAPSQPGQASVRPSGSSESGRGWGGSSASSSAASASSSSRSGSWGGGGSRGGSAPSSAPASAPSSSSSSGGGGRPH